MSDIKRQITIQLKVVADKQVKAETESLKKAMVDAARLSSKIFADTERNKTSVFEAESRKRKSILQQEMSAASAGSQRRAIGAVSQPAPGGSVAPKSGVATSAGSSDGRPDRSTESLDRQRSKAYESQLKVEQKASDSLDKQRSNAYEKELRDQQKAADQKLKAEQKSADALDKQRSRALEKQMQDEERAAKQSVKSVQEAREKQLTANKQIAGAVVGIADNAMVAAKGLAYLGLAGEENSKKIVEGLLLIEDGFNTVRGGIGTFFAIREAIEGVRKATLAAAAANEVLALSQGKAGAADAAGAAGSAAGGLTRTAGVAAAAGIDEACGYSHHHAIFRRTERRTECIRSLGCLRKVQLGYHFG